MLAQQQTGRGGALGSRVGGDEVRRVGDGGAVRAAAEGAAPGEVAEARSERRHWDCVCGGDGVVLGGRCFGDGGYVEDSGSEAGVEIWRS